MVIWQGVSRAETLNYHITIKSIYSTDINTYMVYQDAEDI